MSDNDTQYAEYFASLEELKNIKIFKFNTNTEEFEKQSYEYCLPKAKTEEKMAEYSFNELTK